MRMKHSIYCILSVMMCFHFGKLEAQSNVHQTINSGGETFSNTNSITIALGNAVIGSYQTTGTSINQGFLQTESQEEIDLKLTLQQTATELYLPVNGESIFTLTVTNLSNTTATGIILDLDLLLPQDATSDLSTSSVTINNLAVGGVYTLVITVSTTSTNSVGVDVVQLNANIQSADQILINTTDDQITGTSTIYDCAQTNISFGNSAISCAGQNSSFWVNGYGFSSYQWFVNEELVGSGTNFNYTPTETVQVKLVGENANCTVSTAKEITLTATDFEILGRTEVCAEESGVFYEVQANHSSTGIYTWSYQGSASTLSNTTGTDVFIDFGKWISTGDLVKATFTASDGCAASRQLPITVVTDCTTPVELADLHQEVNSGGAASFVENNLSLTVSVGGAVYTYYETSMNSINQGFLQTGSLFETPEELAISGPDLVCDNGTNYLFKLVGDDEVSSVSWWTNEAALTASGNQANVTFPSWGSTYTISAGVTLNDGSYQQLSKVVTVDCANAGVGSNATEDDITIVYYPNPTRDLVQVETNFLGEWNVSVVRASGQQVYKAKVADKATVLNLQELPVGVYWATFQQNEIIQHRTIIKN